MVTQILPVHRASVTALIWDLPGVQLSSATIVHFKDNRKDGKVLRIHVCSLARANT